MFSHKSSFVFKFIYVSYVYVHSKTSLAYERVKYVFMYTSLVLAIQGPVDLLSTYFHSSNTSFHSDLKTSPVCMCMAIWIKVGNYI